MMINDEGFSDRNYPETRWTLVLQSKEADDERRQAAIGELYQIYWQPLYAYLRKSGASPEDAQDTLQGAFQQMLRRNDFEKIDRERCQRLRNYFISVVGHYWRREHRRDSAKKRGGEFVRVAFDWRKGEEIFDREGASHATPEALYYRQWALHVLANARAKLQASYKRNDQEASFTFLRPFLVAAQPIPYEVLSRQLGISAVGARSAVSRLRGRFKNAVLAELRETVSEGDLEQEYQWFLRALSPNRER